MASLLQGRGSSEDGLPGCPTRRAMEAQTARGLLHPQDQDQGRVATEAAGLTIHNQKSSVQNRARLSPTARFARETQSESLARDAVTRFALEGRG